MFQKEKQNWKQFWKQKRFRKRLLSDSAEAPEAEAESLRAEAEEEALQILALPLHWYQV
jgi:hypothetical protein